MVGYMVHVKDMDNMQRHLVLVYVGLVYLVKAKQ
jgi:hypothetical protein